MSACANCARDLRPEWKFCISCGTPTGVLSARPEAGAPAPPTLHIAPPVTAPARSTTSVRTRSSSSRPRRRRLNPLAVVALVMGCLVSPLAALFGHIALMQIATSGERGRVPAIIAIVLGYASLAFIVGLVVVYLVNDA